MRRARKTPTPIAPPDRSRLEVDAIMRANNAAGRYQYEGLSTSEIAEYNRRLMFGENDEAFPDVHEWSLIVD
jgi:hypothetical protein